MNEQQKELAEKILAQVEREPESLDMSTFEALSNWRRINWQNDDAPVEGCGTTRCIAGWAVHFSKLPDETLYAARMRLSRELGIPGTSTGDVAGELLGLDRPVADRVFFYSTETEAVEWLRRQVAQPASTA